MARETPDASRARRVALEILLQSEASGRFVDAELRARRDAVAPRDRALLQEIVYGSVRHANTLDHLLSEFTKRSVEKQRPAMRWALRLASFQLLYLSRVPAHAAMHQTLEALKQTRGVHPKNVGFANAVLRRLLERVRLKSSSPPEDPYDASVIPIRNGFCRFTNDVLPVAEERPTEFLALRHSLPEWLVERWLQRFGFEEVERLCMAQNRTPRVTARCTARSPGRQAVLEHLAAAGIAAAPGRLDASVVLEDFGALEASSLFARGWLQVQDETAQQIGDALAPPSGARVLDICAAPGGKAAQAADAIGTSGYLLALDRDDEKLQRLRENLTHCPAKWDVRAAPHSPEDLHLDETFTHVIVDAPCSNTGVLARRPEARWRLRPSDLVELADLQEKLVLAVLRHLEPGGRVLYSTCSIETEENEAVVARVFQKHPRLEELATRLFLPHRTDADGGFYSLLMLRR